MKKIPKWITIGIILSIIIFITSFYLYNKKEQEYKTTIKVETTEISQIDYKYHKRKKSRSYTIATIHIDNLEYQIKLSGTNHYVGDTIKIYKYKDKYYQSIYDITYASQPTLFYSMILSALALFMFFPIQIIIHIKRKNTTK